MEPETIEATLREVIANDDIEVTELPAGSQPSPPSPLREDVLSAIREIGTEIWGPIPFSPNQSTGATDGLWIRRAGIPVYGFSAIGVAPDDDRAHGLDERIPVRSFEQAVAFWRMLIERMSS